MDVKSIGLFILRVGTAGTLALHHGLPKLLAFSTKMHTFPDPLGVGHTLSLSFAVLGELLCALLVVVGLFTRIMVVPPIVVMGVAFFVIHAKDAFASKELCFLYLIGFLTILCTGPGAYSADGLFRRVK